MREQRSQPCEEGELSCEASADSMGNSEVGWLFRVALNSGKEALHGPVSPVVGLPGEVGHMLRQGSFLRPRHLGRTQLWTLSSRCCQEVGSKCLGPEVDPKHPTGGSDQALIRWWQARVC